MSTKPQTFIRLLRLLAPMRGVLALSVTMRVLNHSLGATLVVTAVWGAMRIFRSGSVDGQLWTLAGILAGLGFVKGLCRYLEQFTGHYMAFRLLSSLRTRLFDKLETLSPAGLGRDRSGDLLSRIISDVERIEVFYAHTIAPAIVAAVVPALMVAALTWLDLRLAAGLAPFLLAVGVAVPWLAHRMGTRVAVAARSGMADLGACFTDGIFGLRDVLALGAGERRVAEIRAAGERLTRAQRGLARCGAFQNSATDFLIGAAVLAAISAGAALVQGGALSASDFPVALALVLAAFVPLLGISNLVPDFEQAIESANRVFAVLDREPPLMETPSATPPPAEPSAGIRFDAVSFAYPDGTRALSNLTLHVRPGELAALVGGSGAGKSTILHLLLRFWDATDGTVRVFGQDVHDLPPEALRKRFAVVSQRTHLFQTTIRENLLIAKTDASEDEIQRAVRLAKLDAFLATMPHGLDTGIGSLGGKLSGGQRQRLALARAFLKDAPILILDEATSHLDAIHESEMRLSVRAWLRESKERIALVVSHRLESVRDADRIFVIDGGRVAEAGTHGGLAKSSDAYRRVFDLPPVKTSRAAARS